MLEDYLLLLFGDETPALTYSIYRGTDAGTQDELIAFGLTSTTYSDGTAMGGTTYYYKVVAVNGCGVGAASNVASAMLSCCTRYAGDSGCDTSYTTEADCSTVWTPTNGDCDTVWTTDGC